jgi:hypothetical protein
MENFTEKITIEFKQEKPYKIVDELTNKIISLVIINI